MLKNLDVREKAKLQGVRLYEIAAYMGKSQGYITRKMYFELDEESKQQLFKIIDEIAAQRNTTL